MIILLATTAVASKDVSSMESKFVPAIRSKGMWSSNGNFRLLHPIEEGMVDDMGKLIHILKSGEYPTFAGSCITVQYRIAFHPVHSEIGQPNTHARCAKNNQEKNAYRKHTDFKQLSSCVRVHLWHIPEDW